MGNSFRTIGTAIAALLGAALLSGCATRDYAVRGDLMKYESQFLDSAGRDYEYGSTLFEFDEDQQRRGNTGRVALGPLSGTGDDEHGPGFDRGAGIRRFFDDRDQLRHYRSPSPERALSGERLSPGE